MSKMKIVFGLVISAGLVAAVGCSSTTENSDTVNTSSESGDPAQWPKKMQAMSENLEDLMPYVFSKKEFSDANNRGKIHRMMKNFSESVALVPKHAGEKILGKDPIVKFSIDRLTANTKHAMQAFEEGHVEFSRTMLRENMGLCFNCHTTTEMGPQTNFSAVKVRPDFRIYPTEKADYYVATRQYDKATEVLENVLKSPANIYEDPHEMMASLRKYLALQVRVKMDAAKAAATVESFLNNAQLPYFVATDAQNWLKSLREWQKEGGKSADTSVQKLAEAKRLIRKAQKSQDFNGFQSAYVDYLRAGSNLRGALLNANDDKARSEIYKNMGAVYDVLSEMGSWDLPEVYFEACIRTNPGSETAKGCYREFERSIVLGFSGSAGIYIPKEERNRLAELKSLAGITK